ncbi:hypothetical protein [Gordonibacter massiliensis (ex Traore et al. 2017)]|uniref:Uncharacterized protein n=1 Tax=Gordonibacter massiliensis (ex Traore et al. 2017) TaxID=1841863 RepID=A0A842J9Z1_9ACTN|nr:hypothetical protein [Gordonibacter massiliensis (ex Traore et al. 2017)]MBC2888942.1 hypothetical protein [Gordonibacter massiliensis (ex Traore et al. 2017)]
MKEDLDALSWGRVLDIGKQLQAKGSDEADLGAELVSIAQANLSLATRLGIDPAPPESRVMASGMEIVEGGLAEAALEDASNLPAAEAACGFAAGVETPASAEEPIARTGFEAGAAVEGGEAATFDPQEPPQVPAFRSKTELPLVIMPSQGHVVEPRGEHAPALERGEEDVAGGDRTVDAPSCALTGEGEAGTSTGLGAEGGVGDAPSALSAEGGSVAEDAEPFDPEPAPDPTPRVSELDALEPRRPAEDDGPAVSAGDPELVRPAEDPGSVQPATEFGFMRPAAEPESMYPAKKLETEQTALEPEPAHPVSEPDSVRPAAETEPVRSAAEAESAVESEIARAVDEGEPVPSGAASTPGRPADAVEPCADAPTFRANDASRSADEADACDADERPSRKRFARFRHLYESRDGTLCVFEDEHGHLMAVDASKLA